MLLHKELRGAHGALALHSLALIGLEAHVQDI
jgi:hypothetical protein